MNKILNKKSLWGIVFIIGLLLGMLIMYLIHPSRVIKFKDGSQVIASFDGYDLSIDELYNFYEEKAGINTFLSYVDEKILDKKYEKISDSADNYAKNEAEYYYNSYKTLYGKDKDDFLIENGYTEEEFIIFLKTEYYKEKYFLEYLKQFIKDKDIDKEYKNVFGSKYVYTISNQNDKKDLEKVRTELKNKVDIKTIMKKYPNVIFNEIGWVDYVESDTYSKDILSNIKTLKKGNYSKVINDDSFGYVVIYVSDEKEKLSKEEILDDIITVLSKRMSKEDSSLYSKAFIELRRDANLDIKDKYLKQSYNNYVKSISK